MQLNSLSSICQSNETSALSIQITESEASACNWKLLQALESDTPWLYSKNSKKFDLK